MIIWALNTSLFLIIMIKLFIVYCVFWVSQCVYILCDGFTYRHRCWRLPRGLSSANTIEKIPMIFHMANMQHGQWFHIFYEKSHVFLIIPRECAIYASVEYKTFWGNQDFWTILAIIQQLGYGCKANYCKHKCTHLLNKLIKQWIRIC